MFKSTYFEIALTLRKTAISVERQDVDRVFIELLKEHGQELPADRGSGKVPGLDPGAEVAA